jgi:hypothetical protein
MKGEFDDLLKWLFKENLQIKLVNKDHSKDDKTSVVHFSDTSSVGNRVTTGDRSTNTFGIAKFIFHESIPNYIQNDSLKFPISMENNNLFISIVVTYIQYNIVCECNIAIANVKLRAP